MDFADRGPRALQWPDLCGRTITGGTGRTEALSDGVFAMAITLLVLEISVSESAFGDLWSAIAHNWPSYLAYVTTFPTIGGIWVRTLAFRRLQHVNREAMLINLKLLMTTAFLPFPTKLMAEAIHETDAARAAAIFYGGTLLATSLLLGLMWLRHTRPRRPQVGGERAGDQRDRAGDDTNIGL
jgi:uncharacterized membrane protein